MPDKLPHGIVPALVTPFRPDERIDFGAWERIIDFMIESGVDGVFAAGGQGEFFSLAEEERVVAMRFVVQHVRGRVPVYVNVGTITTREALRLTEQAEEARADYLVAITPYYVKPTEEELIEHYVEICRATTLPVLAYNIPERSGLDLSAAAIRTIAERCPNFIGLKDSSGNLDRLPEFVSIGADRPFSVFMGRDHMILPALKLGCAGAVTACANVAPKLFVDLYRAFRAGNMEEAQRLQRLVDPLRQSFALHTFPAVVKEAMEMIGLHAGPCRRPVGPMPGAARERLAAVLHKLEEENYLPHACVAAAVR